MDARVGDGVPLRGDYGSGCYRRRIELVAGPETVRAELEDDFHRLSLKLDHRGGRVLACSADARRVPWTTCPAAAGALARLEGLALARSWRAVAAHTDPRLQCTHLFDLACVAIGLAAEGGARRSYEIAVPDHVEGRPLSAEIRRDDEDFLLLEAAGASIVAPEALRGAGIVGGGFARLCEERLPPPLAEGAQLARRALLIANGRRFQMDALERASQIPGGTCHTFQPGVMDRALRLRGTTRDHSHGPSELLRDLSPRGPA